MDPFLIKIKTMIHRHQLITRGQTVIVGVSGGADSVALLLSLYQLRYELGFNLLVAHVNHNLRRSAKRDEQLTVAIAQRLNIPCHVHVLSKQLFVKNRSIEEQARDYRLQFFEKLNQPDYRMPIALGHHQDDVAETVLMRLLRGTGLSGLRTILPKRKVGRLLLIRPLLYLSREEIRRFLKIKRIAFGEDETNFKEDFLRNRIRLELLPLLEKKYNPNMRETLAHFSQTIGQDYDFLESQAKKKFKKVSVVRSLKEIHLNIRLLLRCDAAMKNMLIRLSIQAIQGHLNQITFVHLKEIEDLLSDSPHGSVVDLPLRISVCKSTEWLKITKK